MTVIDHDDYILRWPPELLKLELSRALNDRTTADWSDRCELMLEDAFTSAIAKNDFVARSDPPASLWPSSRETDTASGGLTLQRRWLVDLLRRADSLPTIEHRKLYYSERRSTPTGSEIPLHTAVHEFVQLYGELEERGYFDEAFGAECVDQPRDSEPAEVIRTLLPQDGLWPLDAPRMAKEPESFLDIIEVLHDLVAAPRSRSFHGYMGCGWHHADFSRSRGRAVYRWRVNRLLDRTSLGVRLAENGEDLGRLISDLDDARTDLVERMLNADQDTTAGAVPHAIALFRARSANLHDKKSACRTLAGVLESRRPLIKERLRRKDEDALFQIANQFAIRHDNAQQHDDYDPLFLDWVFWWYLATVELTDRLIHRKAPPNG